MTMDEMVERMYRKVSRGQRSGPNLELMPQPLRDSSGKHRTIEIDGQQRRIFPVRPAMWGPANDPILVNISNQKPDPDFWS
jgi:hypothetical protein